MKNGLILFALALSLSACAFNKGDGAATRDERQRKILQQSLDDMSGLIGTWDGVINQSPAPVAVRVEITAVLVNLNSVDSSGATIQQWAPSVSVLSTQVDRYRMQFTGTYYKETGELLVRNTPPMGTPTVPADDLDQLVMTYNGGDTITGRAIDRRTITVGTIVLKRRTQQQGPGDNETEAQRVNRILMAQYSHVAGAYEGKVSEEFGGSVRQYGMCLNFHIYSSSSTSTSRPQLLVDYIRYDLGDQSFVKTLDVTLNALETPQTASATNSTTGGPIQGVLTVAISGTLTGDDGHGRFTNFDGIHRNLNLGAAGNLNLQRVEKCRPFGSDVNPAPRPTPKPPTPKPPKPPRRGH